MNNLIIYINAFAIIFIISTKTVYKSILKTHWEIGEQLGKQNFWWKKLAVRTLVLNARSGARSEKIVIMSVGGLPSRSGDRLKYIFSFTIFLITIVLTQETNKLGLNMKKPP